MTEFATPVADAGSSTAALAQAQPVPALIGLDWGTSSLRSYLFDLQGQVLASETLPWGIMRLPKVNPATEAGPPSHGAPFELAFEAACGNWLAAHPGLPVIACGMVGSAQGWVEVPYVEGEADAAVLAQAMVSLATGRAQALHIVPGVLERGTLPNVMRGEETQIVGVGLTQRGPEPAAGRSSSTLIGLPGTHAKWALSAGGRIGHFDTFMTGEVFALLRDHSILGRTMTAADNADTAAFLQGIAVARSEADTSLLATIFSTRTMGLTGQLSGAQQGDYLSGLLIGNELASLEQRLARADGLRLDQRQVVLTGEAGLCERYRTALAAFGCVAVSLARDATERGLWQIAVQAGLVAAVDFPTSYQASPTSAAHSESAR